MENFIFCAVSIPENDREDDGEITKCSRDIDGKLYNGKF